MKLLSLVVGFLFATSSALAQTASSSDEHRHVENHHKEHHGNHKHHEQHKQHHKHHKHHGAVFDRCQELQQMNNLISLAGNQTLLLEHVHSNATRAAQLQQEAASLNNATSKIGAQFQSLRTNATLVANCQSIFAQQSSEQLCERMARFEHEAAVVANTTLLGQVTRGNATQQSRLQQQAAQHQADLRALQANTTLLSFCANMDTLGQCREISRLQALVNLARNTTAVDARFRNNATLVAQFQARVAKESARLDSMRSNATLASVCNSLASTRPFNNTQEGKPSLLTTTTSGAAGHTFSLAVSLAIALAISASLAIF